jgi:hypothetical protein
MSRTEWDAGHSGICFSKNISGMKPHDFTGRSRKDFQPNNPKESNKP